VSLVGCLCVLRSAPFCPPPLVPSVCLPRPPLPSSVPCPSLCVMWTLPAPLTPEPAPSAPEERLATVEEFQELANQVLALQGTPEWNTPEMQAKLGQLAQLVADEEHTQPTSTSSASVAAAPAASVPQPSSKPKTGGGLRGWLSRLWRTLMGDGPATEQQVESHPEGSNGQWPSGGEANRQCCSNDISASVRSAHCSVCTCLPRLCCRACTVVGSFVVCCRRRLVCQSAVGLGQPRRGRREQTNQRRGGGGGRTAQTAAARQSAVGEES
jgi:hypothetical protein